MVEGLGSRNGHRAEPGLNKRGGKQIKGTGSAARRRNYVVHADAAKPQKLLVERSKARHAKLKLKNISN